MKVFLSLTSKNVHMSIKLASLQDVDLNFCDVKKSVGVLSTKRKH